MLDHCGTLRRMGPSTTAVAHTSVGMYAVRSVLFPVPRRCYDSQGTCHRVCERNGRYVHLEG